MLKSLPHSTVADPTGKPFCNGDGVPVDPAGGSPGPTCRRCPGTSHLRAYGSEPHRSPTTKFDSYRSIEVGGDNEVPQHRAFSTHLISQFRRSRVQIPPVPPLKMLVRGMSCAAGLRFLALFTTKSPPPLSLSYNSTSACGTSQNGWGCALSHRLEVRRGLQSVARVRQAVKSRYLYFHGRRSASGTADG
jgi:hypothetical protein